MTDLFNYEIKTFVYLFGIVSNRIQRVTMRTMQTSSYVIFAFLL